LISNIPEQKLKDKISNVEKDIKGNSKVIGENEITKIATSIIFNGREYKYYSRYNKYYNTQNIKKLIYKCINIRKNERIKSQTSQSIFAMAQLNL